MKIFTSAQIHELDKYTIENEPIKSIDLMERAAIQLTDSIVAEWDKDMMSEEAKLELGML